MPIGFKDSFNTRLFRLSHLTISFIKKNKICSKKYKADGGPLSDQDIAEKLFCG